ncbi:MAG: tetratricopeptide repeat protein [Proteobacteria bacterium]|nr:tetratricopeptide repeat protein [Pseudomonadota bacterium]MDA1332321.1 tetratricopeptide repeat protein [Pseudomonadota bacterium]
MIRFLIQLSVIVSICCPVSYANLGDVDESDLDNPIIQKGKAALQEEDWSAAIIIFEQALQDLSGSADLQNFLGYAYRKSGDLAKALNHYELALKINPDHKGALEYLGEAYITLGDLKSAKIQLERLKHLCSPIPCEELKELQQAITHATQ